MDADLLDRHDREVLRAGVVRQGKGVPEDKVLVTDVIPSGRPQLNTVTLAALPGELARGVQLVVPVSGDPDGVLRELGSFGGEAAGLGEHSLARDCLDLVRHGVAADLVENAVVPNLEYAARVDIGLGVSGAVEDGGLGDVTDAERVFNTMRRRKRDTVLINDRVVKAVNGRVDAEREYVLMVGSGHAGPHVCRPRGRSAICGINGGCREDAGGADLKLDTACLVKDPSKDVLVIGDGANHLDHQLAAAHHCSFVVAVVGVLVEEAGVLLVKADDVLQLDRVALGIGAVAIEVLDVAETVTSEAELVGGNAHADIANVEGLLPVVRPSRVAIGHCHLRHGEPVEDVAVVVRDVVKDEAIASVEADSELPLLPRHLILFRGAEGRALWLLDDVGLEILASGNVEQVMAIFDSRNRLPRLGGRRCLVVLSAG